MAKCNIEQQDGEGALAALDSIEADMKYVQDIDTQVKVNSARARTLLLGHNTEQALSVAKETAEVCATKDLNYREAKALQIVAEACLEVDDITKAKEAFEQAAKCFKKINCLSQAEEMKNRAKSIA